MFRNVSQIARAQFVFRKLNEVQKDIWNKHIFLTSPHTQKRGCAARARTHTCTQNFATHVH